MSVDLFGQEVAGPSVSPTLGQLKLQRFSDGEVDTFLDVLAQELMNSMNDSLSAYVEWRRQASFTKRGLALELIEEQYCEVERSMLSNLCWVLALYDEQGGMTFESACADLGEDMESIRTFLCTQLRTELTGFIRWVFSNVDANYAKRMVKRLDLHMETAHILTNH